MDLPVEKSFNSTSTFAALRKLWGTVDLTRGWTTGRNQQRSSNTQGDKQGHWPRIENDGINRDK